jgi:hypothetical protein
VDIATPDCTPPGSPLVRPAAGPLGRFILRQTSVPDPPDTAPPTPRIRRFLRSDDGWKAVYLELLSYEIEMDYMWFGWIILNYEIKSLIVLKEVNCFLVLI